MISLHDIYQIECKCLSCAECDTSSIDDFSDLVVSAGPEFVEQQRAEMVSGARLLHKNLFPLGVEEILDSGGHADRAHLMSRIYIDFNCEKIRAVIDEIPEDTMWIGFVLARRLAYQMPREPEPYKPRRRSKPAPLFYRHGNLFEDFGIYVPGWHPACSSDKAKEHERERREKARRNNEALFPPKPKGGE